MFVTDHHCTFIQVFVCHCRWVIFVCLFVCEKYFLAPTFAHSAEAEENLEHWVSERLLPLTRFVPLAMFTHNPIQEGMKSSFVFVDVINIKAG